MPKEYVEKMEQLVDEGKFYNRSDVIRTYVREGLEEEEEKSAQRRRRWESRDA